jgi:hypothetical protein
VGANAAAAKEIAVAVPFAVREDGPVGIVLAVNGDRKGFEVKPFAFVSVPFGFFDLTDHSRVHLVSPFEKIMKGTQKNSVPFKKP